MEADGERFETRYANNFRLGCNRHEFVLDFGESFEGQESFFLRIVCCPPYAQELLVILTESLQRYHEQYGVIPKLRTPEGP
jgi:hypothetical protein